MKISQIAKDVVSKHGAVLIRPRSENGKWLGEYDVKPRFTGNKRGWIALDATTLNAINTVYEALADNPKIDKFDLIPLHKLIDFVWKHVR